MHALAHFTGAAAEETVARRYCADGGRIRAVRWRCPEGELDLVIDLPDQIVFVEVKARRRLAADAITDRQWARIGAAAARYLAAQTDGSKACRFDVALMDRHGRLELIENARSFDDW